MPAADRIRSFVAVDLEKRVLARLQELQKDLAGAGADVRWVRPQGMHLTLKFLGAVAASHLTRVHAALCAGLDDQVPLGLRAHGLGAFPSLRRPRVVWAGLVGDDMTPLVARVEQALQPLGFATEKRAFTPHVTLGRVSSMHGWARLEERVRARAEEDYGETPVNAVVIYRSTLHRDGAVYSPLWTISLSGHKRDADEPRR